jgi:hypothetical protein
MPQNKLKKISDAPTCGKQKESLPTDADVVRKQQESLPTDADAVRKQQECISFDADVVGKQSFIELSDGVVCKKPEFYILQAIFYRNILTKITDNFIFSDNNFRNPTIILTFVSSKQ